MGRTANGNHAFPHILVYEICSWLSQSSTLNDHLVIDSFRRAYRDVQALEDLKTPGAGQVYQRGCVEDEGQNLAFPFHRRSYVVYDIPTPYGQDDLFLVYE